MKQWIWSKIVQVWNKKNEKKMGKKWKQWGKNKKNRSSGVNLKPGPLLSRSHIAILPHARHSCDVSDSLSSDSLNTDTPCFFNSLSPIALSLLALVKSFSLNFLIVSLSAKHPFLAFACLPCGLLPIFCECNLLRTVLTEDCRHKKDHTNTSYRICCLHHTES